MNTHILIPIKDIENIRNTKFEGDGDELIAYLDLMYKGKEISLDEKDIEEKALEYFKRAEPEVWANYAKLFNAQSDNLKKYRGDKSYILQAYKQALKDLL